MELVVGIIGGTGLDDPVLFDNRKEVKVYTPFGEPSDDLITGTISGVKCILLSRHGRKHHLRPSKVNYRANLWALKSLGCTCIIVSCAVGSLKHEIQPGNIVVLDQFFDRTTSRIQTFYDDSCDDFRGICHIPMAHPFASELNQVLSDSLQKLSIPHQPHGTIVVIEGPRFSSKAESLVWKSFGGSVVGMTTVPEVVLANELGLPYAALALVTDMDAWTDEEHVTIDAVSRFLKSNAENFKKVIIESIPKLQGLQWSEISYKYQSQASSSVM